MTYRHCWAGPNVGYLIMLGNRSSSRVEGIHWRIKDTLQTTGSLIKTFKAVDVYLRKTVSIVLENKIEIWE